MMVIFPENDVMTAYFMVEKVIFREKYFLIHLFEIDSLKITRA